MLWEENFVPSFLITQNLSGELSFRCLFGEWILIVCYTFIYSSILRSEQTVRRSTIKHFFYVNISMETSVSLNTKL